METLTVDAAAIVGAVMESLREAEALPRTQRVMVLALVAAEVERRGIAVHE